jgi:hypothetical protein
LAQVKRQIFPQQRLKSQIPKSRSIFNIKLSASSFSFILNDATVEYFTLMMNRTWKVQPLFNQQSHG